MLLGNMMDRPLSIPSIIDYAAEIFPDGTVVSATVEGGVHDYSYSQAGQRIAQLAHGLHALGVRPGDRVATLAWNGYRHFELYYAIAGLGAVCHTINPRLFPEQIAWIVNHARPVALFYDLTFAPLVAQLAPGFPDGMKPVFMSDEDHRPATAAAHGAYEDLLAGRPTRYDWETRDENAAAGLCYTSGTTGDPKGALYSHRSTLLHAFSAVLGTPRSFGEAKRVLPVVPLFHVNAWGLPYSCPLSGTGLVFPGPNLDGASLFDLMESAGVTGAWGVPTIWNGLIGEMRKRGRKPAALDLLVVGGSAVPPTMIRALCGEFGVEVLHGWGMTEMSPVGTVTRAPVDEEPDLEKRVALRSVQGKRLFGVEMKIVDEDGKSQAWDNHSQGELMVRGPTVIRGYFNAPEASKAAFDEDGWFRTGDIAQISPAGELTIVDRTKDLIKSGGEWISSIELENIALSHPGVASAAAVAVPHPKWGERPLLAVVASQGSGATEGEILAHMSGQLAKWQVPDAIAFVDSLPMTATGKVSKKDLRARLESYFADNPGS